MASIAECSLPVSRRKLRPLPFTRTGTKTTLLTTRILTTSRAKQVDTASNRKRTRLGHHRRLIGADRIIESRVPKSGNATRTGQGGIHNQPVHCRFPLASVGVVPGSIRRLSPAPACNEFARDRAPGWSGPIVGGLRSAADRQCWHPANWFARHARSDYADPECVAFRPAPADRPHASFAVNRNPLKIGICTFTPTAPYQLDKTAVADRRVADCAESANRRERVDRAPQSRNLSADSDSNSRARISGRLLNASAIS